MITLPICVTLLIALGMVALFGALAGELGAADVTRPNIVFIFSDDHSLQTIDAYDARLSAFCRKHGVTPIIAGLMGAALNGGTLMLSQIARTWHITPESWRWIFHLAASPAILGVLALTVIPESPLWLASRHSRRKESHSGSGQGDQSHLTSAATKPSGGALRELLRPPLLRLTLIGIMLGSIPMVGAWAASKWMIPWADKVGGATEAGYKAITQGWWALGAVLGSFFGAQIAAWLGRRRAYAIISAGATALTSLMFLGTAPLQVSFLPIVVAQGFVATLFFGWLPPYLPELFPTRVRAAGSGIAYNLGRFATVLGVLAAGALFAAMGGSYPKVGATCGLIYLLGLVVIWWAPDTTDKKLDT